MTKTRKRSADVYVVDLTDWETYVINKGRFKGGTTTTRYVLAIYKYGWALCRQKDDQTLFPLTFPSSIKGVVAALEQKDIICDVDKMLNQLAIILSNIFGTKMDPKLDNVNSIDYAKMIDDKFGTHTINIAKYRTIAGHLNSGPIDDSDDDELSEDE